MKGEAEDDTLKDFLSSESGKIRGDPVAPVLSWVYPTTAPRIDFKTVCLTMLTLPLTPIQ